MNAKRGINAEYMGTRIPLSHPVFISSEMATPCLRATISPTQSLLPPRQLQSPSSASATPNYYYYYSKKCLSCSRARALSELQPAPPRSEVSLTVGAHLIPHPQKVEKGGEDAYFVSSFNGGVIAVADGVSGWAEQNVDPSLFSRELMANASYFVEDEEVSYDPRVLIRKVHASTSSKGSATLIVAMLEKSGVLKIANVGDCGLKVIRNGQIIFSTFPQEHYFDCPYQLSSESVSQTYLDAVVSSVELKDGDTIVMGSDGFFDNVFDAEILSTVKEHSDVAEAAKALATLANNHSKDFYFDSPYSLEARSRGFDVPLWQKLLGKELTGGKLDDITVIVGQVVST